jgi:hypothetical protein
VDDASGGEDGDGQTLTGASKQMTSEVIDEGQETAWWDQIVDDYANRVWAVIQAARIPSCIAIEVNRLTWMRLADHVGTIKPADLEGWLCGTARREARRSATLRTGR